MAWSGGTYTKGNAATGGWAGDASGGIGIEAGRHDTQDNDFQNGINNCLTKDGQNTPTANLPMGGFKHTGVANASANDQYTAWAQLRNGTPVYIDTANSRLGVGTTAPAVPLHVEGSVNLGSTTVAGDYLLTIGSGTSNGTSLRRYSGTNGIGEIRHRGTGAFQIVCQDGANLSVDTLTVLTNDGTAADPVLSFRTDADTGIFRAAANTLCVTTAGTERVRVDGSGNVGIGASPAAATTRLTIKALGTSTNAAILLQDSTGATTFRVFDEGRIVAPYTYNTTTANAANVNVDSSGNFQRSTSSIRYKTDVQDATHGLAEVLQLRPVTYKGINDGNTVFGGLIAEEVDAIGLSEFVVYNDNGEPDALAYGNMVSLLAKAIQQLNAKVEALEAQLAG